MGGGSEFRKILSSCEIYDPGQDKWFHGKGKSCNKMLTSFPCQNMNLQSLRFLVDFLALQNFPRSASPLLVAPRHADCF